MDYIKHIEYAVEFIESNLKNEFKLADLAKAAGYSEYHFLRVFKQVTHLTPADYIRKRRLSEVARIIDDDNRPICDVAFEYGFNSKENFTRAFKSEHNVLPTEYKTAGNSLKLFDRLCFNSKPFEVLPRIIEMEILSLTGFQNEENYIPKFWNLYNCKKLSFRLSGGRTVADYGVSRWNYEKKRVDYFIGIQTDDAVCGISGTSILIIPGGLYAVFSTPPSSHFDFVNTIHRTWNYINNVWLRKSVYRYAQGYEYQFETYIEASRTYSEDIYIPVEKR